MKLVLTWKVIGESKTDAMNMPQALEAVKQQAETMTQQGMFGDPDSVENRYLVVPGVWDRG
jgi:hypothetical protein